MKLHNEPVLANVTRDNDGNHCLLLSWRKQRLNNQALSLDELEEVADAFNNSEGDLFA